MVHARQDYQRIQDPALHDPSMLKGESTPIGEDEPAFLLRAQDKHFCEMLAFYRALVAVDAWGGGTIERINADEILNSVDAHIFLADQWRRVHLVKAPDMP